MNKRKGEVDKMEIELNNINNKGKRTLVKCDVCGEIFDSSLEKCPVCGVGREHFIPYEETQSEFQKATGEVYIILGNGAAGVNAAEAIRERNENCEIIMISNEPVIGYNRPMLTKALSKKMDPVKIAIHKEDWYAKNRITNKLDVTIEKINSSEKTVLLSDGESIKYDKCIYALGAECFIPPIAGSNKPEVIAIRRISDVEKIHELLPKVKNVVVIGGGVLGLEAAWEMKKSGCQVTVLEIADKLMVRQLDTEAGELLGEIIKEADIEFQLNAHISEITGDTSVTGVKLEDGKIYPAELVIVSSGVRPNVSIAQEAELAIDRFIVVNEKMETNVPDIYACGDCAAYKGVNFSLWAEASKMGKTAGANAAGDAQTYQIQPTGLTFYGINTSLFAIGDNGKNDSLTYDTKEIRDREKKIYKKYYFVDKKLVGVILIGDTSTLSDMRKAIDEQRAYADMF